MLLLPSNSFTWKFCEVPVERFHLSSFHCTVNTRLPAAPVIWYRICAVAPVRYRSSHSGCTELVVAVLRLLEKELGEPVPNTSVPFVLKPTLVNVCPP